jgi:hypothetical protein
MANNNPQPGKKKFKPRSILTPEGMLMFNHLTEASPRFPGNDLDFNFVLLMQDEKPLGVNASAEWKDMRAAIAEAIDFEWGAGMCKDAAFVKTLQLPFKDALLKKQYTGFVAGKVFMNPWTKERPGIVDENLQDIIDPKKIWAGQMCRATVVFFPYDVSVKSRGISVMVNNVQITKSDMPRMDGKRNAQADFTKVGTGATASAPDEDTESPF